MVDRDTGDDIQVRNTAMRLLSRREHSQLELSAKLVHRGFDEGLIKGLLQELEQQDLQSDRRFARSLFSIRVETGCGPVRIGRELRRRGVSDELTEEVIDQADVDWSQNGAKQIRKKFGNEPAQTFSEWARRAKYLETKGFESDMIFGVIGKFDK